MWFLCDEPTLDLELGRCSEIHINSGFRKIYPLNYLIGGDNLQLDQIVHNVNIHLAYQLSKNAEI